MQVFDEVTKKMASREKCARVVIRHTPYLLEYGYTSDTDNVIPALFCIERSLPIRALCNYESLKDILIFNNRKGIYTSRVNMGNDDILMAQFIKGAGDFPYEFGRRYEAVENFNLFEGKQKILHHSGLNIEKSIKYSFGLEFETSMGYIPENLCFRDGLIPLRDGSITGLEYSTVILKGNDGVDLLNQQLASLRKYTAFNKECSLHIHLGGYPLTEDSIFKLYLLCKKLEEDIGRVVPAYTFKSSMYKDNEKDYCKRLPSFDSFGNLYYGLVGRNFYGSFTQPHPNDVDREAKWRIPTRYYWVNFINALCYNVNKTIEFRFLRPTYNFEKIVIWLYILSAILIVAERNPSISYIKRMNLHKVIEAAYPSDVACYVNEGLTKLRILAINQNNNRDLIGRDIEFERSLFKES